MGGDGGGKSSEEKVWLKVLALVLELEVKIKVRRIAVIVPRPHKEAIVVFVLFCCYHSTHLCCNWWQSVSLLMFGFLLVHSDCAAPW